MIPVPNLDDRRFRDIVNEAIGLIPKYCPEWTNHNPADPGVTLIELFAWMTEMIIYRLNRVGEKNYLAFLNLVGIRMRPPQPAEALVTFTLVVGGDVQVVPQGRQVATQGVGDEESVIFETVSELAVLPSRLVRSYSRDEEDYTDNEAFIGTARSSGDRTTGFDVFRGRRRVERILYLGDERFLTAEEGATLAFRILDQFDNVAPLVRLVEWEYWNGRRWREIHASPFELERGVVAFEGLEGITALAVDERLPELPWIRARLVEVPTAPEETEIDQVTARIEVLGDGVRPTSLWVNIDANTYLSLDTSRTFYPFDRTPAPETALYLAHDELLSQEDAHVRIDIVMADPTQVDPPSPSEDLIIEWEFWNGKRWQWMARVSPAKVEEAIEAVEFADTSKAFSQTGQVSFRRPKGMKPVEVNGIESLWLRVRIATGDYGKAGRYELEGDTWVWKHDRPLKPPALRELTLKFIEDDKPLKAVYTYNDFQYVDATDLSAAKGKRFQAFEPLVDENPALYLGFEGEEGGPFPNRQSGIYFEVVEEEQQHARDEDYDLYLARKAEKFGSDYTKEQRVVWEYTDGKKWIPLAETDETQNFTRSGMVEFIGPKRFAWRRSKRFGEDLFWMRARLEMGGYDRMPRIARVLLNSVKVINRMTFEDELVGSSRGTPNQRFELTHKPVLDGDQLYVLESEMPTKEQEEELRTKFGDSAIEAATDRKGYWIRWERVETFYGHHRDSRVYVLDPLQGAIIFGDGQRGMMPPEGNSNLVMRKYYVGGGARGNVGAYAINVMRQPIPYIEGVQNHFPARGGSDAESIDEVKQRGPHVIRSKDRAVTGSDYEWLAKEASPGVARAECVEESAREGQVAVVIVPKFEVKDNLSSAHLKEKLLPSNELLRRVKAYLDDRRLVSCIVSVEKPRYYDISMTVEVVREPGGNSESIKRDVEFRLRKFLHPILGGRNGRGWPFGRVLHKVDLYNVAEEVQGVEFVDHVDILDEDRGIKVESVKLGPKELPHVIEVTVIEKARETIRR